MTHVIRMFVLLCGYEVLPKSVSVVGAGERFVLSLPISAYLLDTREGYVLVDTGLNSDLVHDPQLRKEFFLDRGWNPAPIVKPQHELITQLERIGVSPKEIEHVVLTHMHMDHTGGLKHFRHASISVQRREYEVALHEDTPKAYFETDYSYFDMRWDGLEGDTELMPGLEVLATPGHTPGHQSLVVTLPKTGVVMLVGDAGDLQENFDKELPPGSATDEEAALRSIRRLKETAREREGRLFLGHDPAFIQTVKLAPAFYD